MKIQEAIEILETEAHLAERQSETGIFDAVKLGIEALKRILRERDIENDPGWGHLSGETLHD